MVYDGRIAPEGGKLEVSPAAEEMGIYLAMSKYGVSKEETIYVGDNDIDYETAVNAGTDAMLVTWGPREIKRKGDAKYAVSSYDELGGLLL